MNDIKKYELHFTRMPDLMLRNYKTLECRYSDEKKIAGLPTGFNQLDRLTLGLKRGELIVVGGRPCMGKTTFMMNVARHLGVRDNEKTSIAIFSLEKAAEDFSMSMLSSQSEVEMCDMIVGQFSARHWQKLAHASGTLAEANIYIDDTISISIEEICERCLGFNEQAQLDLVMIDSLQLIKGYECSIENQERVAKIVSMLKELARSLDIPVVISSRLNSFEYRDENRPVLEDLPGFGVIEQYADLIMFIYREEVYNNTPENEGIAVIRVAKQTYGPSCPVKLNFLAAINRFSSIDHERFPEDL